MKRFYSNVGSLESALQERPEILKAVGVYAAIHVCLGVVNDLVRILFAQAFVSAHLIGKESRASCDVRTDDRLQSVLLSICDDLSANATSALQDSHDDSLVAEALTHPGDSALVHALVHVPRFSADEGFIRLDFATKFASEVLILHCQADAMQHKPSRLLSDLHVSRNLVTADTVLAVGDHPHRHEPLIQSDCRILHDGSDLDGKLALGVVGTALPEPTIRIEFNLVRSARRTDDLAIGPAPEGEIVNAVIGIREVNDCFLEALWFAHSPLPFVMTYRMPSAHPRTTATIAAIRQKSSLTMSEYYNFYVDESSKLLPKSLTVMCVDDDAGIRELYGALLGQNGYEVIAAVNGRHALHVFETKENEIDAVILDYEMPGMNGLELATWLKQRHPTLPVIMVSGSHPDLEQMAPFVDAAMGKGVPLRHILDRLQVLLAPSRMSTPSSIGHVQ
jgi:CheY-like chemotaxis protein